MEALLEQIISMDVSKISLIFNLLIVAILVFGLIGFLFGFWKGTYYEISSFIACVIWFVFILFFNKKLTSILYAHDITSLFSRFNIALPDGVSTLGEFLCQKIQDIYQSYGIVLEDSTQFDQSIISLAMSVTSIISYLVLLILGIIFVALFGLLLYFVCFRFIAHIRKAKGKRKSRIWGGFIGFVKVSIVACLFLAPFSSLVSSLNNNVRDESGNVSKKENVDSSYYNALMNLLEGYNNSYFAKILFTFSDSSKNPLDVSFMDYLTSGVSDISFYQEVGSLGGLVVDGLATGVITSTGKIDYVLLLQNEFMTSLFDTISQSTLIHTVLSLGITLAVNYPDVKNQVDLTKVNFFNIDWSKTSASLQGAYDALYENGVIDQVIDKGYEDFYNNFSLDSSSSNGIKKALRNIGNDDLISQVMPYIVVSYLNNLKSTSSTNAKEKQRDNNIAIPDELLDVSTYKDIAWGDELYNIYESMEGISSQYYAYYQEHLLLKDIASLDADKITNSLFGTNIEFAATEDHDKYENNVFINGGTYQNVALPGIKNILGLDNDESGLLNIQLMQKIYRPLLNMALDSFSINDLLTSNNITLTKDLNQELSSLSSTWQLSEWKKELSAVADIIAPVLDISSIISSSSSDDLTSSILSDNSLYALNVITNKIDDSQIANELLPGILQDYTTSNDGTLIGQISYSDLNFTTFSEGKSFSSELHQLVTSLQGMNQDLISLIDDITNDNANIINTLVNDCSSKSSCTNQLLKLFNESEILNQPLTNEDDNLTKLMIELFSSSTAEDDTLSIYQMSNGLIEIEEEKIREIDAWDQEIDALTSFIGSLKGSKEDRSDCVILDYITGNLDEDYSIADNFYSLGDEIERIFQTIDASSLLKVALPSTFNQIISENLGEDTLIKPDFNNIESWSKEGTYLSLALQSVQEVTNGTSINDLDWLSVDKDLIKESAYDPLEHDNQSYASYLMENSKLYNLLSTLYDTQSIGGSYSNSDSESNRTNGAFDSLIETIIKDALESSFGINVDEIVEKSLIENDFKIDGDNSYIYDNQTSIIYVSWKYSNANYEYHGEIYNLVKTIIDIPEDLDSSSLNEMLPLLDDVNECYVLRTALGVILETKIDSLSTDDSSLMKEFISRMNIASFHEELSSSPYQIKNNEIVSLDTQITTRAQEISLRQQEIECLKNIVDQVDVIQDNTSSLEEMKTILEKEEGKNSSLETLLNNMHDSIMFNTLKDEVKDVNPKPLTSFEYTFEYIFSLDEVKDYLTISESYIQGITNWTSNDDNVGEITLFNDALYSILNNDIFETLSDSNDNDDIITLINNKLTTNSSLIEDLFLDMHSSALLDYSLPSLIDNQFVKNITSNFEIQDGVSCSDTIYQQMDEYLSSNNALNEYSAWINQMSKDDTYIQEQINLYQDDQMALYYLSEGYAFENIIKCVASLDLENLDIATLSSDTIETLSTGLQKSYTLNYRDINPSISFNEDPQQIEKSVYQIYVSYLVDQTMETITPLVDTNTTATSNDIVSHPDENQIIISLINDYQALLKDDGSSKLDDIDIDSLEINENYDNDHQADDISKISTLIDHLSESNVFNANKQGENSCYQGIVRTLVSNIISTLQGALNISEDEIAYTTLDDIKSYEDESNIAFAIIRIYSSCEFLKNDSFDVETISVDEVNSKLDLLTNQLKLSAVYNYLNYDENISSHYNEETLNKKSSSDNEYSLYQHLVIYMVNQVNATFESSLNLYIEKTTRDQIKSFDKEYNLIFDLIAAYQNMGLNGASITNEIINQTFIDRFKDVLIPLYNSDVFHYTKNVRLSEDNPYHNLSIFEQMVYTVLDNASIDELVYSSSNSLQEYAKNPYEGFTSAQIVYIHRIQQITQGFENENIAWYLTSADQGEIDKLMEIILDYKDNKFDTSSTSNLDDYVKDENSIIEKILNSYLVHDIVPNMIHDYIANGDESLDNLLSGNYLSSPYKDEVDIYVIEKDASTSFNEKNSLWMSDIKNINESLKLINKIQQYKDDENSAASLKGEEVFKNLLTYLGDTIIFEPRLSDILIVILSKYISFTYNYSNGFISYTKKVSFAELITGDLINETYLDHKLETVYALYQENYLDNDLTIDWTKEGAGLDDFIDNVEEYTDGDRDVSLNQGILSTHMIENLQAWYYSTFGQYISNVNAE